MPRPATGADIGSSSAKLVSGEVKGNSFTVRSFTFALNGDGTLEGGWRALGELGKVGTVRVGLNGREVNLRYTRVPRLPDWQLKRLMRFETEEIGGQSEADVASDFNVLPVLVSCAIVHPPPAIRLTPDKAVLVRFRRADLFRASSFEKWPFVPSRIGGSQARAVARVRRITIRGAAAASGPR